MKYIVKKYCLISIVLCCAICNKNTENKNSTVKRSKRNRSMFVSNCVVYDKKNQG